VAAGLVSAWRLQDLSDDCAATGRWDLVVRLQSSDVDGPDGLFTGYYEPDCKAPNADR